MDDLTSAKVWVFLSCHVNKNLLSTGLNWSFCFDDYSNAEIDTAVVR